MPLGQVLYEAGTVLSHVYFPTTAVVSLLYVMQDGDSAEIAVAGNDGLVGISLFMGGGFTPSRALIQNGGQGFRMAAEPQQVRTRQGWGEPTRDQLQRVQEVLHACQTCSVLPVAAA